MCNSYHFTYVSLACSYVSIPFVLFSLLFADDDAAAIADAVAIIALSLGNLIVANVDQM